MKNLQNLKSTCKAILISLFLLNTINSYGQTVGIDSLKIFPDNPITTDSIKIICYYTFPSGASFVSNSNININDSLIEVQAYYFIGPFQVIYQGIDTIFIGNLSSGTYELIYYALDSLDSTLLDVDTIYFIVSQTIKIDELKNSEKFSFLIYPNPVKENLIIKFQKPAHDVYSISKITILDIRGNIIYEQNTKKDQLIIENKVFPIKGIYLLKIEHNNNLYINKIVIN